MADVKQMKKIVPLITCQITLGVNMSDLDFGVQIDPVKQPIQRKSVGSGYMSHCWTSAFVDHFNHGFVVFTNVQLIFELRRFCACDNVLHIRQFINFSVSVSFRIGVGLVLWISLHA